MSGHCTANWEYVLNVRRKWSFYWTSDFSTALQIIGVRCRIWISDFHIFRCNKIHTSVNRKLWCNTAIGCNVVKKGIFRNSFVGVGRSCYPTDPAYIKSFFTYWILQMIDDKNIQNLESYVFLLLENMLQNLCNVSITSWFTRPNISQIFANLQLHATSILFLISSQKPVFLHWPPGIFHKNP